MAEADPTITLADFARLDIRIGTVVSAEKVADSDRLLRLVFNLGDQQRQIIAAMAEFFPKPSDLVGRQMPVLVNIEPRRVRGHESAGMIVAADVKGQPVLLAPETPVPPGSIVR